MKKVIKDDTDKLESSSDFLTGEEYSQLPRQLDQEYPLSPNHFLPTSPLQNNQRREEEGILLDSLFTPHKPFDMDSKIQEGENTGSIMREVGDEITGIDPVIFLDDQEERKRRGATSSRNDSIASGSPPEIPPRKESLGNIVQVVKNDEMQKLLRRAFLKLKSQASSSKFSSEISPINPSVGDSSDSDYESYKEADNSVKFSYQYCHDKTFQGKNYKIFRNNKDDKTKISYLSNASSALNPESSNQESDIANKVKKSIEESIKKMFGDKADQEDADDKKTGDKKIDNKTKLKFYKYLALAVKLGGVGNKGTEYKRHLNELNESIAKEEDKLLLQAPPFPV